MRFFKPFRSQKFIIELWLADVLKSPIKIKLPKLLLCSSSDIQDDLKLSFDEGYMSHLETISFSLS